MAHPLDLPTQIGPLVVTLVYVGLYYAFQIYGLSVKTRLTREYASRNEKFDRYFSQDREMLAADRVQLNTLEHMGPFLALLWLHAVLVSPLSATVAGAVYVAARMGYPFAMGRKLGRGIPGLILASTVPGYLVLVWLIGGLIWAMAAGKGS
jgi:hypothetical protein